MDAPSGRPSKLTHAVQERVVQALCLGNYRQIAAAYAGIDERTLRRWLQQGTNEPDGPYRDFRDAVHSAEAKSQVMSMGCVGQAARNGDWRAAAWMLERRVPERFSPNSRLFDPFRVLDILEQADVQFDREQALRALAGPDAPFLRRDATKVTSLTSEMKKEVCSLLKRVREGA